MGNSDNSDVPLKPMFKTSRREEEIISAIKIRLKRGIGLVKNNKNQSSTSSKLLENFTDKELYEIAFIYSPVVGLMPSWFRRAIHTYAASSQSKRSFIAGIRTILIESINVFSMTSNSKKVFISLLVKGVAKGFNNFSKDFEGEGYEVEEKEIGTLINYGHHVSIVRERIKFDSEKYPEKYNYKRLFEHFKSNKTGSGNIFDAISHDKLLTPDERDYVRVVLLTAQNRVRNIESLRNCQVLESCNPNNTAIGLNGRMSRFKKKNRETFGEEEQSTLTYSEQLSEVMFNVAKLVESDTVYLEELLHEYNTKK